jgi:methyl-accepting chemotaxis protein WspA
VKNWTVRLRIQASFAVIIAIMLSMAAMSYIQLLTIEREGERVLADSVPGIYYISKIRSGWTDNLLRTQALLRTEGGQGVGIVYHTGRDDLEQSNAQLLDQFKSYGDTISTDAERAAFDAFLVLHKDYMATQAQILRELQDGERDKAVASFEGALVTRWGEGRKVLNDLI